MATFILIHGSMHGGWCWEEVAMQLAAAGHRVLAPDLPGRPGNPAPRADCTLTASSDLVAALVDGCDEPAILVGHSAGGVVVSAVAERVPAQVARLVYVAALLLPEGEAFAQYVAPMPMIATDDGMAVAVRDDATAAQWMYNRSDPAAAAVAASRLVPESVFAFSPPLRITPERFGRVPRTYVGCLHDLAVPIDGQRRMNAELPCEQFVELDADHSPWLSRPAELAAILDRLSRGGAIGG
ncbi:MAG: alpha/beta fold hydrolase [Sphingopyxis sp.]|nr:alpha/beta fold hydrolase [Sphingopyxis sp.]